MDLLISIIKIFSNKKIKKRKFSKIDSKIKIQALDLINSRLEYFNQFYGFKYNKVSVRNQRTRWGSCSNKGNLSFNIKILFLPEKMRDYIIVHELCHLKEFNHSKNFWSLIEKTIPDYKNIHQKIRYTTLSEKI